MTQPEALAEAKRRWGGRGEVSEPSEQDAYFRVGDALRVHGIGRNFHEAFESADLNRSLAKTDARKYLTARDLRELLAEKEGM